MLAFLDSPIQLVVVAVVVLLVFGPQKLPEMLHQLGRAIREFKRTTSDLTNSLNVDDRYEPHYNPPRYDSYGNQTDEYTSSSVPEEDMRQLPSSALTTPADAPRGDFAASAFADTSSEYGVMPSTPAAASTSESVYGVKPAETAPAEVAIRPAEGSVSRNAG
jgi:TatA/E family protein of Tat protein translocase